MGITHLALRPTPEQIRFGPHFVNLLRPHEAPPGRIRMRKQTPTEPPVHANPGLHGRFMLHEMRCLPNPERVVVSNAEPAARAASKQRANRDKSLAASIVEFWVDVLDAAFVSFEHPAALYSYKLHV